MQANGAAIIVHCRLFSPLGADSWNSSTFACAATIRFSSTARNFHIPQVEDGVVAQARPPIRAGIIPIGFRQLPCFVPGVAGE
jgi:hypothetical protein